MATFALCKVCKDKISLDMTDKSDLKPCGCGALKIDWSGSRGGVRIAYQNRDEYALVDEKGFEISVIDEDKVEPSLESEKLPALESPLEIIDKVIETLKTQTAAVENFSQMGRYSPATNQDLASVQTLFEVFARAVRALLKPN